MGAPEVLAGHAGVDEFYDIDFVVARTEIDYRASVGLGELLEVDVRVSRMGNSSFDFSYRVTAADGRLVAEATTTQVSYDWGTRRKPLLAAERRREIERLRPGRSRSAAPFQETTCAS